MTTLKKGSSGVLVRAVQYILGADAKHATGKFDSPTIKAVKKYQKKCGIKRTGIIDAGTWAVILGNIPTLRQGDTGGEVRAVEVILNLTLNGHYDASDITRVIEYQAAHELTPDGIIGVNTWCSLLGVSGVDIVRIPVAPQSVTPGTRPKDYKQYAAAWAKKMYSSTGNKSQTMKSSGCGPTAMANIVATFGNPSITPWDLAQLAMKWGCRTANSGTAWSFFKKVFLHYTCFSKFEENGSHATAIAALNQGALVVASMGPGYWTKGGHFITLWKCDGTTMYACDPASGSRKQQALTAFKGQVKRYFIFYPLSA